MLVFFSLALVIAVLCLIIVATLFVVGKIKRTDKQRERGFLFLIASGALFVSCLLVFLFYDMIPPIIETYETTAEYNETIYISDLAKATDNRDDDVSVTILSVSPESANISDDHTSVCFKIPGDYTVTISAVDRKNNEKTAETVIHIVDLTAPVFTSLSNDTEVNYGKAIVITDDSAQKDAIFAIAEDGTSNTTLSIVDAQNLSGDEGEDFTLNSNSVCFSTLGDYSVTIEAKDDYGNTALATVTVTVIDSVAPEFSGIQTEYYLADDESAPDYLSGVTATDEIDGDLTNAIVLDALNVSYGVPGEYTITYHVSDAAGNETEKSSTVTIKDTTPPVISLSTTSFSLTVGDDSPDYASIVSASDTIDGDVTTSVTIDDSNVKYSTPGTYEVTYTVSDSSGNTTTKSATVTVKSKTTVTDSTDSSGSGTVYITKTGSKYHRDGCRYLSKSKIAISKSRAIAQGYEACSVCNP